MRTILTLLFLLLTAGNLLAGSGYDRCIKEESALKAKEKGACSGLSYVLNPTGCFATRKALQEYTTGGKCRKIGSAEQVELSAPPPASPKGSGTVRPVEHVDQATLIQNWPEAPHREAGTAQLRDELARLKEEISRLKAENERLKEKCRE